jgi:hypothetical protein
MTDQTPTTPTPEARGFPFLTVGATLVGLFAFLAFMLLAYHSPNFLDEPKTEDGTKGEEKAEPKADPATRLNDLRAKNQAVLDGHGAKMSAGVATTELLERVKRDGKLPFPMPEPPAPPTPEPKKTK